MGDFGDVGVGHRFVEGEDDTVGEDGFGVGAVDLAVVHLREAGVADGPGAAEEIVVLEDAVAVDRCRDVAGGGGGAFGAEGVDPGGAGAAEAGEVEAEEIKPVAVGVAGGDVGRVDAGEIGEEGGEELAGVVAAGGDVGEAGELRGGDGGLGLAHAVVWREVGGVAEAGDGAVVVFVAPRSEGGAEVGAARGDDAAVAAAEVFVVVEGVAGEVGVETDGAALVEGAPSLRAVFDEGDAVLAGERGEGGGVGGIAGEVHDHDRAGAGGERAADGGGVEVVGALIDVGEDGDALLVEDADDGAHVGDGRDDHLIARAEAEGGDGDVERGGAGGRGEEMGERVVFPEFLGEGGGLRALPVEEGILVDHRGEAGELGRAPAARAGERFVDDGHGSGAES